MADLYPVTDDNLSEAELTNYVDFSNLSGYFEDGCAYTPNHTNEEVTANSGKAYIRDTGGDLYVVEPDQATLSFPDQNGDNWLYLTFDPTAADPDASPAWEISSTEGGPADPKLLRAKIDTANDDDVPYNDEPSVAFDQVTHNPLVLSRSETVDARTLIPVESSTGAHTVTLGTDLLEAGKQVRVVDAGSNASSNTITVDTEGSATIDPGGASSKTITVDDAQLVLEANEAADAWRAVNRNVEQETTVTEQIGNDRFYAGAYGDSDPDDRLDSALSDVSSGDVVFLENATYDAAHTISTRVRLAGPSGNFSGAEISGTLTFGAPQITVQHVQISSDPTFNSSRARFNEVMFNADITSDDANDISFVACDFNNNSLTFGSGSTGGIIDACANVSSVTDNGSNTVGDTS